MRIDDAIMQLIVIPGGFILLMVLFYCTVEAVVKQVMDSREAKRKDKEKVERLKEYLHQSQVDVATLRQSLAWNTLDTRLLKLELDFTKGLLDIHDRLDDLETEDEDEVPIR